MYGTQGAVMLATDWRQITPAPLPPVGQEGDSALAARLLRDGALRASDLHQVQAEAAQARLPLAEVLARSGQVDPGALARAVADHSGMPLADPLAHPPDPRLIDRLGARRCLALGVVPLRRVGGAVQVAVARPDTWPRIAPDLERVFGPVTPAHAPQAAIQSAIAAARGLGLRLAAETCVPAHLSTRSWPDTLAGPVLPMALGLLVALAVTLPLVLVAVVLAWLALTLVATAVVRAVALAVAVTERRRPATPPAVQPLRLPVVSVLVPLYGEPGIAPRLLQRLGRLDYPRALLDVMIVLEAKDTETRAALAACRLPGWMRVIIVPDGPITTKPRAMNYALDFARGSVIGIYDAEDAPDPDQIRKVVQRFAECGPEVACLQGCLDYYNPRTNLIARLFTAEYASWFRVVMPALQRLGWPMPLGGTTLFLRRAALDRVGAWDAHNVTEDADLGVRLARHGLRTEMLPTTTHEEANCRLRPWVKQRSRWIKGHILTWAVHMRAPRALRRDLGWRGFLGYQVVFLGAQSQVLLAPVMWSFWAILAGLPHPVQAVLPDTAITGLIGLFLLAEVLVVATAAVGLARTRHRGLGVWAPLLHLYHPLGAIAGWRAVWEAFANPFYWAKTSHGHFDLAEAAATPRTVPLAQAQAGLAVAVLAVAPRPHSLFRATTALPVRHAEPAAPANLSQTDPAHAPETAAARIARALAQDDPALRAADAARAAGQRVRTSPASIFSRVSKAREIWVRNAS